MAQIFGDNENPQPVFTGAAQRFADDEVRSQLDQLAKLTARFCEAPSALFVLAFDEKHLLIDESSARFDRVDRAQSFCAHVMAGTGLMTICDAQADARFADHPLVNRAPHIRFYAGQPLVWADGTPLGALCVFDSQPRAGLLPEQAETMATLGAAAMALLEKWRQAAEYRQADITRMVRLDQMERQFAVLVDALPQLVWSTPADGMPDYFSAQWCSFTGKPAEASYGNGWIDFLHPDDVETTTAAWQEAVASGGSYAINYRLRRHDGKYVWMLARGLPIRDETGAVVRWLGTCTDIEGQVQASELLKMMSQELSHRIKNLFAVTQGLIAMSLRNHPELAPFAGEMQSRLRALGRAHDLVRPQFINNVVGHSDTTLFELLQTLLLPYADNDETRCRITGDDIVVGEQAATPIGLFVHEMGTNSVKYGALSAAEGRIAIEVTCGEQVQICWQEHGGPPVVEPSARGFGYRLAELSIVRQLGGTLEFDWLPQGVVITATIPANHLASRGLPDHALEPA